LKRIRSRAARLGIFVALVSLTIAAAALTATAHRTAASHGMTPAVGSSPVFQNLGAVDGPLNQPGRLRNCQLAGTCYGPDQIRNAYGFQPLLDHGITGAGRTIVIIDAYGSNTLQADFNSNNAYWGLPAQTIQVIAPYGVAPTTASNAFGWKGETTLDVNTAHYIAPGAKIVLVVAKSNDDADILAATKYVSDHNLGDVVSQSFGEAEQCMAPALLKSQNRVFKQMTRQGITLLASSGDAGAAQPSCDGSSFIKAASTPASDPNVTGIGGTDLVATPPTGTLPTSTAAAPSFEVTPGGRYVSESVWNEGIAVAGGGGFSTVYERPDYQSRAVRGEARGVPDVAYSASLGHSILVLMSCNQDDKAFCGAAATFVFGFGGTSAGSPQWAGLVALADQLGHGRIGLMNPTLYQYGTSRFASVVFHDVTTGDNSVPAGAPGTPITGFAATRGWDAASGLGSPKADRLVPVLAFSQENGGGNQGGGGDNGGGGNGGG
jgi:subtilase family serine protease